MLQKYKLDSHFPFLVTITNDSKQNYNSYTLMFPFFIAQQYPNKSDCPVTTSRNNKQAKNISTATVNDNVAPAIYSARSLTTENLCE